MPNKPRFIVLLPTFNGKNALQAQMQSVLQQQGVAVRVLVSDDQSSDGTAEYVQQMSRDDDRITLLPPKKMGGAGGNYFRLIRDAELTDFDYLAFCDQDDVWNLDKLLNAAAALQKTGMAGYSAAVTAQWPDGRKQVLAQCPAMTETDFLFEGAGQGCTFVLSRDYALFLQDALRRHQALTEGVHYHDWVAYALVRATSGPHWYFDPKPSMTYRQHGGNDTGARSTLAGAWSRLQKIRDGWYLGQVQKIMALVDAVDATGGKTAVVRRLLINSSDFSGRLKLAYYLLRQGRRRSSDRIILGMAALLGWFSVKARS